MLILAIDTSTPTLVTGLVRDGVTVSERILPKCREQEERLVPCVQECLAEADATFQDVTAIVVGCGPGPFTGLRVGMATVLVTTDARRREVYWVWYQDGCRVEGPGVQSPSESFPQAHMVNVPEHLADKLSIEGAQRVDLDPSPASLVAVADLDSSPQPLVPLYLRRPDVKEPKPKPPSSAVPDVEWQ